jgi:hypothetical protein
VPTDAGKHPRSEFAPCRGVTFHCAPICMNRLEASAQASASLTVT